MSEVFLQKAVIVDKECASWEKGDWWIRNWFIDHNLCMGMNDEYIGIAHKEDLEELLEDCEYVIEHREDVNDRFSDYEKIDPRDDAFFDNVKETVNVLKDIFNGDISENTLFIYNDWN